MAELLIGRRLREQAPIIERLLPILAPASGSRFVAENERIAMAVFFALMEQVAGLADSVVTGGLSVIQGGARLGLEVEELIQARDRLRVVRRQFASIVRQQGELPSQSMIAPAMALGRLFMHLWNLIVEMRDAQRNNQPFRFGRAAGHFSTAVVGVADVVQELRRSGVLAGEAMEELALHELPAPTAARNQLRANLLEAGQHPPGIGEYQAHHIIPYQLRTDKVIRRLDQAFPPRWDINGTRIGGWDINDAENGVWLPTRQEGPFAGRVASHSGPHGIYTSSIEGRLRTLNNEVESGLISDGELLDAVRSLQDEYRARFVSELKGVPLH